MARCKAHQPYVLEDVMIDNRVVHFQINGQPVQGILTGRDYEEIEVTTADGLKYYLDDQWLDHAPEN